jgi:hypothetical protein
MVAAAASSMTKVGASLVITVVMSAVMFAVMSAVMGQGGQGSLAQPA